MKVFKFGGASVNSPEAVRNMASIVQRHYGEPLVIVVSAMGKTTNRLEQLVPGVRPAAEHPALLEQLHDYHTDIIHSLFPDSQHPVYADFERLFDQLTAQTAQPATVYNYDYDQTVCFGELMSTSIINYSKLIVPLEKMFVLNY